MSLLHRSVLAQILAAVDPLIETGAAIFNPLAGAGAKLVLTDVESIVDGSAAAAVTASTSVAPAPAAAAPVAPPLAPVATSPAPAPAAALSAQDVITALVQTLQALQARV